MLDPFHRNRATINLNFNSLDIEIPAKKNWFVIIFMIFWLSGWTVGEGSAIHQVFNSGTPLTQNTFILIWLLAWTFGGAFAIYTLLWQLIGKEKISIGRNTMTVERLLWMVGSKRVYEIHRIKNLMVNQLPKISFGGKNFNYGNNNRIGRIKFDYNRKTITFASNIDETEAQAIINRLKRYSSFSEKNFADSGDLAVGKNQDKSSHRGV